LYFFIVSPARPSAAELKNTSKTKEEDKLHHDEMRILRRPEGLAAGLNYARILGSVRKETEPGSTGRSLEVRWRRCVLCCAIWIRRVIMNIHGGVAIRSDVAKLRDGNSCLRDVVGVFDSVAVWQWVASSPQEPLSLFSAPQDTSKRQNFSDV
jgi:hypothetical protein